MLSVLRRMVHRIAYALRIHMGTVVTLVLGGLVGVFLSSIAADLGLWVIIAAVLLVVALSLMAPVAVLSFTPSEDELTPLRQAQALKRRRKELERSSLTKPELEELVRALRDQRARVGTRRVEVDSKLASLKRQSTSLRLYERDLERFLKEAATERDRVQRTTATP